MKSPEFARHEALLEQTWRTMKDSIILKSTYERPEGSSFYEKRPGNETPMEFALRVKARTHGPSDPSGLPDTPAWNKTKETVRAANDAAASDAASEVGPGSTGQSCEGCGAPKSGEDCSNQQCSTSQQSSQASGPRQGGSLGSALVGIKKPTNITNITNPANDQQTQQDIARALAHLNDNSKHQGGSTPEGWGQEDDETAAMRENRDAANAQLGQPKPSLRTKLGLNFKPEKGWNPGSSDDFFSGASSSPLVTTVGAP